MQWPAGRPDAFLVTRRSLNGHPNERPSSTMLTTTLDFLGAWLQARFSDDDRGASLVEYALLVALIAVVCIVAVTFLGKSAKSKFNTVGSSIAAT